MQKVFKIITSIVIFLFLIYVGYRNINLRKVSSTNLIKDEQTSSLYHRILPNTVKEEWTNYYYSRNSLTIEEIPKEIKYNIAYKNTNISDNKIAEEKMKNSYERIFGQNTYQPVESFIGGCNTYTYDQNTRSYNNTTKEACKPSNIYILSKIVDAKTKEDIMEITIAIAYLDKIKKMVYKECNKDMSKCSNILEKSFTEFDEANLDPKKYDLSKYKFTYELINDEYYFNSVKKIK